MTRPEAAPRPTDHTTAHRWGADLAVPLGLRLTGSGPMGCWNGGAPP